MNTTQLQTITVIERDGTNFRSFSLTCHILSDPAHFDLHQAVKNAVHEYLQTPEGQQTYEYNCHCFNWADFEQYVSNDICKKIWFRNYQRQSTNTYRQLGRRFKCVITERK